MTGCEKGINFQMSSEVIKTAIVNQNSYKILGIRILIRDLEIKQDALYQFIKSILNIAPNPGSYSSQKVCNN